MNHEDQHAYQARIAELEAQAAADRDEILNLTEALLSSRRIGAAVGILMASHRLTEDQAFQMLGTRSQNSNRKLRDVAEQVLLTGSIEG